MKCPKCGFNSFEFLDSCKKCGNALTPFKQNLGIRPVILPSRQHAAPLPDTGTGFATDTGTTESGADNFSWEPSPDAEPAELPGEAFAGLGLDLADSQEGGNAEGPEGTGGTFEAFSVDELYEPEQTPAAEMGKAYGEDGFTDLLESSGTGGRWSGEARPTPSGEFAHNNPATDEFDSLFSTSEPDKH